MDDMNWIEFHAIYGALGLWRMIEKRCSFSLMQCAIDTVWPFPGLCVSRRDCVGMERFMLHSTPIFLFEKGIMRMNSVIVHGFQHFHNVAWRFCSSNMLQWLKYIEKEKRKRNSHDLYWTFDMNYALYDYDEEKMRKMKLPQTHNVTNDEKATKTIAASSFRASKVNKIDVVPRYLIVIIISVSLRLNGHLRPRERHTLKPLHLIGGH